MDQPTELQSDVKEWRIATQGVRESVGNHIRTFESAFSRSPECQSDARGVLETTRCRVARSLDQITAWLDRLPSADRLAFELAMQEEIEGVLSGCLLALGDQCCKQIGVEPPAPLDRRRI